MAPGASSINDGFQDFYAPRTTEPSSTYQQPSMPPAEHQKPQRSIGLHNSRGPVDRTKPDDDDQIQTGCFREIKNYKAGDEFLLLWKWVDDFMDKRRAKIKSSKSHNVNTSTSRQPKSTPSSSRKARQVPRPAVTPSPEAVRRQATDREDMREYIAQRHTPWGELIYLYRNWKDQQAKKKADQARQKRGEEIARSQATVRRDESPRGRSTNRREPPRNAPSPPDQDHAADSQPGIARKPVPIYNKKRGEVQKHAVKIAQLPPGHNSVHLQHTPSNNYRARPSPARGQKDKFNRNTHFSDFLHQEHNAPSALMGETEGTYAGPGEDADLVRNSHFSSVLDPAKAIKKAKEAEKAKGPKCYICGTASTNSPGGYRDNITNLWVCVACQQQEDTCPVQCTVCGADSPDTGYARNGLWMCKACRSPTTPKELPPSPKFSRKATSKPKPASRLNDHSSHASLASHAVPISEYDSDHLYSDDSYETRATTPLSQRPIGLGITLQDSEEEEEEEFRPIPPLKDSKYYQDSPTLPAMDYNRSYLRKPGTKHPYAPSSASTASRTAPASFAPDLPGAKPSKKQRRQQDRSFNPTTYPYPSPPGTPTPLHKPRPASSVYPTDEPAIDFPYPPPPIPQRFSHRPKRSSSVSPGTRSKAALARTEPASPRSQSSPVSTESGRTGLNRRSSWYDFWKPVFEKPGEGSP